MQTGKYLFLFYFGGSTYCTFVVFVRERSHWSMFLLGGLIFVLVGGMNQVWGWETGLIKQTAAGVGITLAGEFMTGCIVNLWLGWDIWDYSELPGNLLGQICPQFALLWIPLVLLAIVLDDVIRWRFYGEERPRYYIFGQKIRL